MDDWVKVLLAVLAVIVGVPLLVLAVFVPFGMYGMMGYGGMGYGSTHGMGGVGLFGLLFFVLPLVLVAAFVYLIVVFVRGRGDPALRELRAAYARGDLSTDEFEERRDRLEK